MIKLIDGGVYLLDGNTVIPAEHDTEKLIKAKYGIDCDNESAKRGTIAYGILSSHNRSGDENELRIKFDAMASHDITYVGIIQTARASGLTSFPIPYVLTNCHNSLCAVGGTINEDDHVFGLSAAEKYGGIFVPPHIAVIHSYMREMMCACGNMIIGSDSHTRYGALGTLAIGEGGGELVKQLLDQTYDIKRPQTIAVVLKGKPKYGVGPHDVALALIGAVFENGFALNRVLEFVGEGVGNLSADFRCGVDVMTTETRCLSSIWRTDDIIKDYYITHGRAEAYRKLEPSRCAYYDGAVIVDLDKIECMIALPTHPSNVYPIHTLNENLEDILAETEKAVCRELGAKPGDYTLLDKIKDGRLSVQQGVIAGCAGGSYENISAASDILHGADIGCGEFALSVYPASQPVYIEGMRSGICAELMTSGATMRTAFCGPCFGAGDVPPNNGLSIRHSTRNFKNREGSKPSDGQYSAVALMDARSIAATARCGGRLTAADELDVELVKREYHFDRTVYDHRVYNGFGKPVERELVYGPNIADWPKMQELSDNILMYLASYIDDPVTTTDELIPSGETSSYRSNPEKLSSFALSRRDPDYVHRAKTIRAIEARRLEGEDVFSAPELKKAVDVLKQSFDINRSNCSVSSFIYAYKPGDGSAREQAASCQKVLGGLANVAVEYATKRYRSNLINWGMLPFTIDSPLDAQVGDLLFVPDVRTKLLHGDLDFEGYIVSGGEMRKITLHLPPLTENEKNIISSGCLINFNRAKLLNQ